MNLISSLLNIWYKWDSTFFENEQWFIWTNSLFLSLRFSLKKLNDIRNDELVEQTLFFQMIIKIRSHWAFVIEHIPRNIQKENIHFHGIRKNNPFISIWYMQSLWIPMPSIDVMPLFYKARCVLWFLPYRSMTIMHLL